VNLLDRLPGADAKVLGTAAALKIAPPSSGLKSLSGLVSKCMPALVLHDVSVASSCVNEDYPAMELLYNTDAYEYLLYPHFAAKGVYHPKFMRQLCSDDRGAPRRLVVLWNARFVSAC